MKIDLYPENWTLEYNYFHASPPYLADETLEYLISNFLEKEYFLKKIECHYSVLILLISHKKNHFSFATAIDFGSDPEDDGEDLCYAAAIKLIDLTKNKGEK